MQLNLRDGHGRRDIDARSLTHLGTAQSRRGRERSRRSWTPVDVRWIGPAGVTEHPLDELPALLGANAGVVWVDIPSWDATAARLLGGVFGFHPLALRDCGERNQVPKVHAYVDYSFLVLHDPHAGAAGHVHYVELDLFVGPGYLVTVHGPLNPAVDPAAAMVEVNAVVKRLDSGRLRPTDAYQLPHALVSALTGRLRNFTAGLAKDVRTLEQRVTAGHLGDPEHFLEEMFRARHGLLTVMTMAGLSREVYARIAKVRAFGDPAQAGVEDTVDQFERLQVMTEGQKDYLEGAIEFYRARTTTKMTGAAERLAVIAAVTLPVTSLSSVLGVNLIVNDETKPVGLVIALVAMAVISGVLLVWCKRRGWW